MNTPRKSFAAATVGPLCKTQSELRFGSWTLHPRPEGRSGMSARSRGRANVALTRESRPDSGLGSQVKSRKNTLNLFLFRSAAVGLKHSGTEVILSRTTIRARLGLERFKSRRLQPGLGFRYQALTPFNLYPSLSRADCQKSGRL